MKILQFLIFFLSLIFVPLAATKNVYSGNVSYLKFNDDGSFAFQLTVDGKLLAINNADCSEQNTFLVKKQHGVVKYEKLTRMRRDIRDVFLMRDENTMISVSTLSCDKQTGFLLVDNIMLGTMQ